MEYAFDAELWEYGGAASWVFVTLPAEQSDEIRARYAHAAAGFGAIKVRATVGSTQWTTSIFYDSQRKRYLLPLKKQVRAAAGLQVGAAADFTLTVLV